MAAVLWTGKQASLLIALIRPEIREANYHILIGGSVAYRGYSADDLDLYFCPLNGFESDPSKIFDLLNPVFGPLRALRDSPDYAAGDLWTECFRGEWQGKRIDIFIR